MLKDAIAIAGVVAIILFIYSRELQLDRRAPEYIREYEEEQKKRQIMAERAKIAALYNNPYVLLKDNLPSISTFAPPNLPEPVNFSPRWTFPETVPSDYFSIVSKRPYMSMDPPYSNY